MCDTLLTLRSSMKLPLRNITTAYILVICLVKAMALPFIVLQYNVNKNYIATNLCENRARPEMQCHGSCHLKKQLSNSLETPQSQNTKAGVMVSSVDFCESTELPDFNYTAVIRSKINLHQDNSFAPGFPSSVFHPPLLG